MTAKIVTIETSHGRPRLQLRRPSDGGTPALPEPVESAPIRDPKTGRFIAGNRAWTRRTVKDRAKGIATLNPKTCPPWLAPHVEDAQRYGQTLADRFPDETLAPLVGDCADAHAVYKALLTLGAQGDAKALSEARAWLREHRATLRELAALAALASEERSWAPPQPLAPPAAPMSPERVAELIERFRKHDAD